MLDPCQAVSFSKHPSTDCLILCGHWKLRPCVQVRELQDPVSVYRQCMDLMTRLAAQGLVHCDFNEFNLLVRRPRCHLNKLRATEPNELRVSRGGQRLKELTRAAAWHLALQPSQQAGEALHYLELAWTPVRMHQTQPRRVSPEACRRSRSGLDVGPIDQRLGLRAP